MLEPIRHEEGEINEVGDLAAKTDLTSGEFEKEPALQILGSMPFLQDDVVRCS
jgi:hypothetical protein